MLVGMWFLGIACDSAPTLHMRLGRMYGFLPDAVQRTSSVHQEYLRRVSIGGIIGGVIGGGTALALIIVITFCGIKSFRRKKIVQSYGTGINSTANGVAGVQTGADGSVLVEPECGSYDEEVTPNPLPLPGEWSISPPKA